MITNTINVQKEYLEFIKNLKRKISMYDLKSEFKQIIFLCVGTNKIIGDMIGPMVGEDLKNRINKNTKKEIIVFGNMENTLNLKNAKNIISNIKSKYVNPFIITIDTALGKEENLKKIYVTQGEIEIGKAVSKGIKYESHVNIKGVVGKYSNTKEKNINTLKNVEPESIFYLSSIISNGITEVIKNI